MAIKSSRGVTSGKGTPQRLEGQNGDITIRTTPFGKKLFVKDANKWHSINLDINTSDLNSKINALLKDVRSLKNSTRNRPVLDSAILRKPGAANIQLKNSSGALNIRNAADDGDVELSTTYTAAKVTEVDGNTGAVTASEIKATALTDATAGILTASKAIVVDSNKAISNMVVSQTYTGALGGGTHNLISGTATVDSSSGLARTLNGIAINLDKTSGNTTNYTMNVMDLQVDGSSKLKVNDTGGITSTGTASNGDGSSGDNRYLHITTDGLIGYRTAAQIKGDIGGTAASSTFTDVTINGTDGSTALQITSSADTGDLFKITTNAHGATTIETEDDDATAAHLTLDADGDIVLDSAKNIILDSASGNFIAKKAGTEFSAANSAYAGMILGYTRIQNNGTASLDNLINLTNTMTVLQTNQGTDVKVTFKAPPSGNVEIQFSCRVFSSSTSIGFALSSLSSFTEINETHTYDNTSHRMDETDIDVVNVNWAVTGLTAGDEYTYWIAAAETSGAFAQIHHGRFRASGKHYPPIIVKAVALPATIVTGE